LKKRRDGEAGQELKGKKPASKKRGSLGSPMGKKGEPQAANRGERETKQGKVRKKKATPRGNGFPGRKEKRLSSRN